MAHKPRPRNKGNAKKYNAEMKAWRAYHKNPPKPLSEKDKADVKKEADLAKLLKNKPKGGYKDTSPKPKPKKPESKKNNLKVTGIGPVAPDHKDAESYAKHLNKRAEKRKIKGEGPVTDRKKYGETLKKRAAEKEAEEFKKWKKKTRNSPARLSGAWTDKELWEKAKQGRQWAADRKSGKLKKDRKKNLKITTWRDLE